MDTRIDGDSNSTFYEKCGKKCPIMIFISTNDGYRFGGYTNEIWPKESYKKDDKSFLFSLDLKQKYKCIKTEYAIYYSSGSYFSFGNNIYIHNNCTKNSNSKLNNPYSYNIPEKYGLNGGKNNFTVKYYEVYEIEY